MGSSRSSQNKFIVQGSILAIASIMVRLIGVVYRIPMIRIIGNDGYGIYVMVFNIYNVALILSSYSLPLAVSKLIAARNIKKEYRNASRVLVSSLLFALIVGFTFTCLLYFGADYIAATVYKDSDIAQPLRVLSPTIFVFSVMGVLRGFFQGKNTMLPTAVSQILEQIVNAIVSITAAYLFMQAHDASTSIAAYGASGGTLGTLMGALTGLIFLLVVFIMYYPSFKRMVRKDRYSPRESYRDIYKLLIITIVPVILSQTVYQLNSFLDDIIFKQVLFSKGVDDLVSNALIGGYSGKYKLLTNVPIAISSALASAMIPSIVASRTVGANNEVHGKIHSAVKFNMIIAIPAAIGMSVLGRPILQLFFSSASDLEVNMMVWGSVAIIFYALSTITNSVLQAVNLMRLPVLNAAASLGIHLVLVFCLLKFTDINIYALVIGNVTFPLVICILNWVQISRQLFYKQEVIKTFCIPLISASIMGIVAYFSYKLVHLVVGSNLISVSIAIVLAVIVYFASLVALKGLSTEEIARMPKGYLILRILKKIHMA